MMVLKQKKLFQAGPSWTQLGMSTTNCHSYTVMLARIPLIIASNTWVEMCSGLTPCDFEWIQSNQVLLNITETVFEEEVMASTDGSVEATMLVSSQ